MADEFDEGDIEGDDDSEDEKGVEVEEDREGSITGEAEGETAV
jgi:hypothetical protein